MARNPIDSNGADEVLHHRPAHLRPVPPRKATPDEPIPAVRPEEPASDPSPSEMPEDPIAAIDRKVAAQGIAMVQIEARLSKVERRIAFAVAVGTGISTSAPHWLPQILERLF